MSYEEQLWLDFRTGDPQALARIAEDYFRSLLRYGMKFGMDAADVEDCIQDLFMDLWQNRLRINDTPSVRNYLFKSLRNRITERYRNKNRLGSEEEVLWHTELSDFHNAESDWIEKEKLHAVGMLLHTHIEELPRREKEALYLRYYENLTIQEVAEIMGVNRQSAANFLQKALVKLRRKYCFPVILLLSAVYFFYK